MKFAALYTIPGKHLAALQAAYPCLLQGSPPDQDQCDLLHNVIACILYDADVVPAREPTAEEDAAFELSLEFDDDMFESAAQQRAYRG